MISFGSGADALTFDIYHICLFIAAMVFLALATWSRHAAKTKRAEQDILQEAETTTMRARLEGELSAAQQRADEDAARFAEARAEWNETRAGLERKLSEDRAVLEKRVVDERNRLEAVLRDERQTLQQKLEDMSRRAETAENKLSAYEAQSEERMKAVEEERRSLQAMAEDVQKRFQQLADSALRKSQTQFIELADQHLKKHKEGAEGELKKLIQPINESFKQFNDKVESVQKVTAEERSTMQEQIRALMDNMATTQKTTTELANALRAPKGGGRWGEETLRNVLEMAGLSPFADFSEQTHTAGEDGAIRPDVTINMPGGRQLVIDSKVSVDDYLLASETADESQKSKHFADHARNIRKHIDTLGKKSYWEKLPDTVDFVAMFIPGENFYAAALEVDRSLFDTAARNRVIIVTPSTLIALAKAVSYGWRQEEAANNAREVTEMARELYKRISVFGDRVARLGKSINQSAGAYNDLVSSLEARVLPQARKFEDMGLDADGKSLPQLAHVENSARDLKQGSDLLFSELQEIESDIPPQRKPKKRA